MYICVLQMQVPVEVKVNQKQWLISHQLDQRELQVHDHNQLIDLSSGQQDQQFEVLKVGVLLKQLVVVAVVVVLLWLLF